MAERVKLLEKAIDSARRFGRDNHRVSISWEPDILCPLKYLREKHPDVVFYPQDSRLRQFEHFRGICEAIPEGAKEDFLVVLLDDDDMLIKTQDEITLPRECRAVKGIQYVGRRGIDYGESARWDCEQAREKLCTGGSDPEFAIVDDLSGYGCTLSDMRKFFAETLFPGQSDKPEVGICTILDEKIQKLTDEIDLYMLGQIDLAFMKYVDQLDPFVPHPFVFHRVWVDTYKKAWWNLDEVAKATDEVLEEL